MRAVVTLLALAACTPAHAQVPTCAPHSIFVDTLATTYGENRRMFGVVNDQQVVSLFANDQTGTWTLLVTGPDGTSCMASSGSDYDATPAPLPPNG
jgi:hypothetical protein